MFGLFTKLKKEEIMKFLNIALSVFSVTPIAIVLSCSQQPTNTNNSSDETLETLKNLKEQLN